MADGKTNRFFLLVWRVTSSHAIGVVRTPGGRQAGSLPVRCLPFTPMFGTHKKRGDHRYYLLPGMGRSNRRHRRRVHRAAVFFGILVSALFAALLYYIHTR